MSASVNNQSLDMSIVDQSVSHQVNFWSISLLRCQLQFNQSLHMSASGQSIFRHILCRSHCIFEGLISVTVIFVSVFTTTSSSSQLLCTIWYSAVWPSSQRHTLLNREYVHSNSEVIILNNDQHQLQKIISTNNQINWRIKRQHTTIVNWCYCLR